MSVIRVIETTVMLERTFSAHEICDVLIDENHKLQPLSKAIPAATSSQTGDCIWDWLGAKDQRFWKRGGVVTRLIPLWALP